MVSYKSTGAVRSTKEKARVLMNEKELAGLLNDLAGDSLRFLKVPPRKIQLSVYFTHGKTDWTTLEPRSKAVPPGTHGLATDCIFDATGNFYSGVILIDVQAIAEEIKSRSARSMLVPLNDKISSSPKPKMSLNELKSAVLGTFSHEFNHVIQYWQVARDLGNTASQGYYRQTVQGTFEQEKKTLDSIAKERKQTENRDMGFDEKMAHVYQKNPFENDGRQASQRFVESNGANISGGKFDKYIPVDQLMFYVQDAGG